MLGVRASRLDDLPFLETEENVFVRHALVDRGSVVLSRVVSGALGSEISGMSATLTINDNAPLDRQTKR